VPCFNDGGTLGETVDSLRIQGPCELVVVNDGSTDEATLDVLRELEDGGVRVVHQENQGLSAARTAGLRATRSRYVLPLDADDLLAPEAVERLADALDDHPEYAAAWGAVEVFGDVRNYNRAVGRLDPWRITYYNGLPYSSLFRRTALEAVGGWQLNAGGYEDWDVWMSFAERGYSGIHVPTPTLRYRVHGARMFNEARERHDLIYAELRRRHPTLFESRRENWRRSREPWREKLLVPAIDRLGFLSFVSKRRLYLSVSNPPVALRLALRRLRPG
jgi:glycosyltransferase involved in cell wall biosynthesis